MPMKPPTCGFAEFAAALCLCIAVWPVFVVFFCFREFREGLDLRWE